MHGGSFGVSRDDSPSLWNLLWEIRVMTDVSFETHEITGGPNEMGLMQSLFNRTLVSREKVRIGTDDGTYEVAITCLQHCGNSPHMWHFKGRGLPKGKVPASKIRTTIPYPPVVVEGEYDVKTRKGSITVTPT